MPDVMPVSWAIFMRISQFIAGAAVMAALSSGCSKKPPLPTVTFDGYGPNGAMFNLSNPGKEPVVCTLQVEPDNPGSEAMVMVPAHGSTTEIMSMSQTNGVSLTVTVMRATPVKKFIVPMQ